VIEVHVKVQLLYEADQAEGGLSVLHIVLPEGGHRKQEVVHVDCVPPRFAPLPKRQRAPAGGPLRGVQLGRVAGFQGGRQVEGGEGEGLQGGKVQGHGEAGGVDVDLQNAHDQGDGQHREHQGPQHRLLVPHCRRGV